MVIAKRSRAIDEATELLRQAGVFNPTRLVKLIRDTISFLELDLTGMTVLTEAASGPYVVTPVIAALAGAQRVIALTRDSRYATTDTVIAQTRALETLCCVSNAVEIHTQRTPDLFAEADIVTNLGFVRPIDAEAVAAMRRTAVVPLMCEAWEFRPGDVDLDACQAKGIPVVGTNESYPGLDVFAYSGWLCLKLLIDAQIEIHKSKIIVVGGDQFGKVIERRLSGAGAMTYLVPTLSQAPVPVLRGADAILVADYTSDTMILGPSDEMSAAQLASVAPGITVVVLAGYVDSVDLQVNGIPVYPPVRSMAHRMTVTLAGLGPRPVIELHAAGLKVGQLLVGPNARKVIDGRYALLLQPTSKPSQSAHEPYGRRHNDR